MRLPAGIRASLSRIVVPACLSACSPAFAQSPSLSHTIPSAVVPGQRTVLTLAGEDLAGATQLWTSFPAQITERPTPNVPASESGGPSYEITVPPDVPRGLGAIRLATTHGISNLLLVLIDDLPSVASSGTNRTLRTAQTLAWPVAVEGACDPLKADYYRIEAKTGQRVTLDAVAQRLGSALDPVVRLLDGTGRELAYCDDDPGVFADARLSYEFSKAGRFLIEVRDTRYQGGPRFRYRLRVGEFALASFPFLPVNEAGFAPTSRVPFPHRSEKEPNDSASSATPVPVPVVITGTFGQDKDRDFYEFEAQKGQRLVLSGKTRSLGSPCDLYLELRKANDSLVAEANVTGADEGTITNTFTETGTYRLLVEELNRQGGPGFAYRLEIKPLPPGFTLSVDTDKIEAPAGGSFEINVSSSRREFDGPIALSLGDGGTGLVVSDNVIPAKTNATQLKVSLPPDLTPGRLIHFTVHGHAQAGDASVDVQASTMPAIRKLFPQMLYPPEELDGLIALGVKAAQKPSGSDGKTGAATDAAER